MLRTARRPELTLSTWSLGRRVTALCLVAGILLSVIAVSAGLTAAENNRNVGTLLDWFGEIRTDVEKLMAAVVNAETGAEAYIVSGDQGSLQRYRADSRAVVQLGDDTSRLIGNRDPALRRQLQLALSEERDWRRDLAEPAIARVEASGPDPAQAATTIEGLRLGMRHTTQSLETLQQQQRASRAALERRTQASGRLLAVLLFCAAVVVLGAGVALVILLRRWVTGPIVEMAEEVRRVANGDYTRRIHGEGPPELMSLARDVSTMRRRIVSELAEVESARAQIEAANRQLKQQADELTRSNRDLEQFAYVASHDLQEPLRKVAGFCQLLQRRYAGQLDERAEQYLAFAVDGAQRMQLLINDLLAFSRIGRGMARFTDVDLNTVVRDAVAQLAGDRRKADGRITWDELPTVRGVQPLLLDMITNLMSNALKFHRPGVPARVHLSARRLDDHWEISCQDNGIGIPPEFADKVFVIFQRLHSREAYSGTGIGLAIVKKIIEYHGGQVWVDTQYDGGTLIRFTLPALTPGPDQAQASLSKESAE